MLDRSVGYDAKEMRQPKGAVAGYRALAVQDSGDPVGRHFESPAEFRCAHSEFLELLGKMPAGMDCRS